MGVGSAVFSPDGHRLLSGNMDKIVRLWDRDTGKEVRRFEGHTGVVVSVAFSPDGRHALSGGVDKTVRLWDVQTGTELSRFEDHENVVLSVAFSPDGRRVFSAGADGARLRALDGHGSKQTIVLRGHLNTVSSVAFAPDGKALASACYGGRVVLWDAATGAKLREWQLPGALYGGSLKLASDGRHLAAANSNGTVYILRIPPPPAK